MDSCPIIANGVKWLASKLGYDYTLAIDNGELTRVQNDILALKRGIPASEGNRPYVESEA